LIDYQDLRFKCVRILSFTIWTRKQNNKQYIKTAHTICLLVIKKHYKLLYLIIFSLYICIRKKNQHFYCFKKNLKILESAICWPLTVFGLLDRVRSVDHLPYFYWLLKIAARVCHVIPCIRYNKSVIDWFLEQQLLSSDPVNNCILLQNSYRLSSQTTCICLTLRLNCFPRLLASGNSSVCWLQTSSCLRTQSIWLIVKPWYP